VVSASFDRFGRNGAHVYFRVLILAELARKRGLKGEKRLNARYGITRPGLLYKSPVGLP